MTQVVKYNSMQFHILHCLPFIQPPLRNEKEQWGGHPRTMKGYHYTTALPYERWVEQRYYTEGLLKVFTVSYLRIYIASCRIN